MPNRHEGIYQIKEHSAKLLMRKKYFLGPSSMRSSLVRRKSFIGLELQFGRSQFEVKSQNHNNLLILNLKENQIHSNLSNSILVIFIVEYICNFFSLLLFSLCNYSLFKVSRAASCLYCRAIYIPPTIFQDFGYSHFPVTFL